MKQVCSVAFIFLCDFYLVLIPNHYQSSAKYLQFEPSLSFALEMLKYQRSGVTCGDNSANASDEITNQRESVSVAVQQVTTPVRVSSGSIANASAGGATLSE